MSDLRKQIRRLERQVRREEERNPMKNLYDILKDKLPSHLMPGNIGQLGQVMWPFEYTMTFDFSADAGWSPQTNQSQSFQVDQEASFIMTGISWNASDYSVAGSLAPLQVEFQDVQSRRFLQDVPIPLQALGRKQYITKLAVPFIISPNGRFQATMSSFVPAAQAVAGQKIVRLTFHGVRTRTEHALNILNMMIMANQNRDINMLQRMYSSFDPSRVVDMSRALWPYFQVMRVNDIIPGASGQSTLSSFKVTQEAGFVATDVSKEVFYDNAGVWTYVDPNDFGNPGQAPGLSYTLQDAQSSRLFSAIAIPFDNIGDGSWPYRYQRPLFVGPNGIIKGTFQNGALISYFPFMTFNGFRVYTDDTYSAGVR